MLNIATTRNSYRSALAASVSALVLLGAAPGFAQSSDASSSAAGADGDEIVVVAQKRAENIQDVPISISAFSGNQLAAANVTEIADLPRLVPTLRFGRGPGSVAARLNVRGIGSFGNSSIEPSVAVFLDDVYIPRPASVIGTFLDVQAVEVLSGPQGTLFGRNASVGALTLRAAQPQDELSGGGTLEAGTGARYRGEAYVNIPLSDGVAMRAAGQVSKFGGYWHNDLTGKRFGANDYYAGRISLKMDFDRVKWIVRADYTDNESETITNWAFLPSSLRPATIARLTAVQGGVPVDLKPFDGHANFATGDNDIDGYHWGLASDLNLDIGGGFTARLVSGYRDWKTDETDDASALAVPFYIRNVKWRSKSHSQDLQLISPKDLLDGRLDFVAGLYYFHEKLGTDYNFSFRPSFCATVVGAVSAPLAAACAAGPLTPANGLLTPYDQKTDSYAAYGQATFAITPRLKATAGTRFTRDEKSAHFGTVVLNPGGGLIGSNEQTDLKAKGNKVTWRANLAWTPIDDMMLFATYSTGFKSGGFNNGSSRVPLGQLRIFAPETVKSVEFGIKSQWLDRAVTFNATAYRMDVSAFQERSIDGVTAVVRNVGAIRNQGIELDTVVRPVAFLKLNANLAYLDSKFTRYDRAPLPPYALPNPAPQGATQNLKGVRPTYSPKWSGSVGAEIGAELGSSGMRWAVRTDLSFISRQNLNGSIDNSQLTIQPGYSQIGARLSLAGPDERWKVSVYGENLTDKGFCDNMFYQVLEGPLGARFVDPDGTRGTAVRCVVGAPRRFGVAATMKM